jgi:hypothetical protein
MAAHISAGRGPLRSMWTIAAVPDGRFFRERLFGKRASQGCTPQTAGRAGLDVQRATLRWPACRWRCGLPVLARSISLVTRSRAPWRPLPAVNLTVLRRALGLEGGRRIAPAGHLEPPLSPKCANDVVAACKQPFGERPDLCAGLRIAAGVCRADARFFVRRPLRPTVASDRAGGRTR